MLQAAPLFQDIKRRPKHNTPYRIALKNIFKDDELNTDSVTEDLSVTESDGKNHYFKLLFMLKRIRQSCIYDNRTHLANPIHLKPDQICKCTQPKEIKSVN